MSSLSLFFAGVDWGTKSHRVCIINSEAERLKEHDVAHTGKDMELLVDELHAFSPEDHSLVRVGIELKHSALVETLVLHGFSVYSINPRQSDRFRDRHSQSGAKDDRLDAFVIADALIKDLHCFCRVEIDSPDVLLLREVSRALDQTKEELRISANRLWQQLHRYYAPLLRQCPGADEAWLWELVELAPTPEKSCRLHTKTVADLLKRHRIRRFGATTLLSVLREKPLPVADGVADACAKTSLLLVARLKLLSSQEAMLEREIKGILGRMQTPPDETLGQSPGPKSQSGSYPDSPREESLHADLAGTIGKPPPTDAAIVLSHPGVGTHVGAVLLSEAAQQIASRDLARLRALAGIAAVTVQSGKSRRVKMRRACNGRLRNAMHYWAATCIQKDAHMRTIYQGMRQSGKSYARALRGLADHLLRVLIGALRSQTLYDPLRWPDSVQSSLAA